MKARKTRLEFPVEKFSIRKLGVIEGLAWGADVEEAPHRAAALPAPAQICPVPGSGQPQRTSFSSGSVLGGSFLTPILYFGQPRKAARRWELCMWKECQLPLEERLGATSL